MESQYYIDSELKRIHRHLMYLKFPYHSVSVVHHRFGLGFHCIFMKNVEHLITDELKSYLKANDFTYSIVTPNK